jgi:hypothetical protein
MEKDLLKRKSLNEWFFIFFCKYRVSNIRTGETEKFIDVSS